MTYYSTDSTNYITANYRQLAEHKRMLSTLLDELCEVGGRFYDDEPLTVEEINQNYAVFLKHLRSYKSGLFSIRSIRSLYQKYYKAKMSETAFAEKIFSQLTDGELVLVTEAQISKLKGGKRYAL